MAVMQNTGTKNISGLKRKQSVKKRRKGADMNITKIVFIHLVEEHGFYGLFVLGVLIF
jgi:hypothetical protein